MPNKCHHLAKESNLYVVGQFEKIYVINPPIVIASRLKGGVAIQKIESHPGLLRRFAPRNDKSYFSTFHPLYCHQLASNAYYLRTRNKLGDNDYRKTFKKSF
jgi:hypothetical protein